MTETQHRPAAEAPKEQAQEIEMLNEMFNAPEATPDATLESREVSPVGSALVRAAERVSTILEARAVNKAHGEALKEYRDRDHSDYVDHLSNLADSTEATPMAKVSAEMALQRENRIADREQFISDAKDKVRGFGNTALHRLKNAGLITLGIGVMGAEAGAKGAKKAGESARFATTVVKTNVEAATAIGRHYAGEKLQSVKNKVTETRDAVEDTIGTGVNKVTGTIEAAKEALEYRRKAAIKQKETALTRKYERHATWMKLKRRTGETIERTREVTVEQKRKIGRFATRAKASGEAAVDAWKNN